MSEKEIITSDKLAPGRGLLSRATRFGNLVYVQGCTGRHPSTGEVGKDIREQTRYTLERIKLILEAAGTSLDNVLTNTCYVSKAEDLKGSTKFTANSSRMTARRAPRSSCSSARRTTWWK